MTNGDRIRKMTDHEMAVSFACPSEMSVMDIPCDGPDGKDCITCALNWLQAEEDD